MLCVMVYVTTVLAEVGRSSTSTGAMIRLSYAWETGDGVHGRGAQKSLQARKRIFDYASDDRRHESRSWKIFF